MDQSNRGHNLWRTWTYVKSIACKIIGKKLIKENGSIGLYLSIRIYDVPER